MSVINITSESFENEVMLCDKTVLVDFFANWCAPCRAMSTVVDEIAEEHPEIKVCKVNVDEQPQLATRFSVESIPTMIIFKNGKAVKSSVGSMPKRALLEAVLNA